MKELTLEHYQEKEQTLNCASYSAMLKDKLKSAIHHKRRRLLSKTAFLYHDSACPCVMVPTVKTIQNLKFEVLPHPPYSLDLIPCDFMALVHLERHNMVIGLAVMKKLKK